ARQVRRAAAAVVRRRWTNVTFRVWLLELRSAVRSAGLGAADDDGGAEPRRLLGDRSGGCDRKAPDSRAGGVEYLAGHDAEVYGQRSAGRASRQRRDARTTHGVDVR